MRKDKIQIEIQHADRICENSEIVWGWGSPAGKRRVSRRIHCFLEFLDNQEGATVLEIGGGTGIFSRHLIKHNINLVAVDISFSFIKRSREATGKEVRYVRGDAENLPFRGGLFDAVFAISVLHHLDVERTLSEISRMLRKGGKVFFTEPNMLNPHVFTIKNIGFIKHRYHWVPHETAFLRWSLRQKFERAGFSDITVKNFDFVHPGIPERLVPFADRLTRYLEKIPGIREISGSLLVTAVKDGR